MTIRDTAFAPGAPCWAELFTSDSEKARAFYGELFGWEIPEGNAEFGGYANMSSDGNKVAGLMVNTSEAEASDMWTTYFATTDIDASVDAAKAAAGQVYLGPNAVAELGSFAVIGDPAGAAFGLWQAGAHTGFEKHGEPNSLSWSELYSKDFTAATSFYAKMFCWEIKALSDTDEFRYSTGHVDGEAVAGLMDASSWLPVQAPSHWAPYFDTADIAGALTKVERLGGKVLRPVEDSPHGKLAEVADPTGVTFKLRQE